MWTRERVHATIAAEPALTALFEHARERLDDDPGHDAAHCVRVAAWTLRLCPSLEPRLAIAAALLHDIVNVPKNSSERASASELSARHASELLPAHGFSPEETRSVADAVRTHSFSRGETPASDLGRALCDADRLEALGVIGLFRTVSTGTRMGSRYFHAEDPWARSRKLDDRAYSVDHFFTKLLKLPGTLHTEAGRAEAERRAEFLRLTLRELAGELGHDPP
jgi:uncharacterized protein